MVSKRATVQFFRIAGYTTMSSADLLRVQSPKKGHMNIVKKEIVTMKMKL